MPDHTDSIDVFFNNDAPAAPYYKVKMVDAVANSYSTYDQLLASLKENAKKEGLDGIMVVGKNENVHYTDQLRYRHYGQTAVADQQLSAIGIKYYDKIDYINRIVKSTTITENNPLGSEKLQVYLDYYGTVLSTNENAAKDFYLNNISPFDITSHLKGEVAFWEYQKDEGGNIVSFRLNKNDITYISAVIDTYGSSNQITIHYKILDPKTNKKSKYDLVCSFDTKERLVEKQLFQKKYLIWREKMIYENDLLSGYSRYAINDGNEKLIFTAGNSFFSKDDLPRPLNSLIANMR